MSERTNELIKIILDISNNGGYVIKSIGENLAELDRRKASAKELETIISNLERELSANKDASKTMCELYDSRCETITRLRSLLQRMQSVGDELAKKSGKFEYRCDYVYCIPCGNVLKFSNEQKEAQGHSPSCPVTRWEELKKEMEG